MKFEIGNKVEYNRPDLELKGKGEIKYIGKVGGVWYHVVNDKGQFFALKRKEMKIYNRDYSIIE